MALEGIILLLHWVVSIPGNILLGLSGLILDKIIDPLQRILKEK